MPQATWPPRGTLPSRPPADTTAPTISGVGASSITVSGATISWTTNEASDTQVDYGPTTGYGSSTALASALVTSHSANLSGLQASTLYHYRVKSRDAAGNLATSGDFTFTTAGDTTAPTISGVGASLITVSGATISWTTNEASDTQVDYGPTTGYGSSTTLASALVTSHSANLSGLQASTLYHYRVKSRDAAGNLATSGDFTFTTAGDTTAPTISGVGASSITVNGATISWTTNEASDTQVDYGPTTGYGSSTVLASAMVTSHSASLSGLQASTLYHYRVKSRDAAGNLATSGDFTFTTSGDTTAPTISGVGASSITVNGATISWTTNEASDTQVDYGPTTGYGSSTTLASALVTSHSANLSGLQASTLYHYRVKSRDAAGNLATSGDFTFTTSGDNTAPTISGVGASSITVSGATISWTTNEASDTQVDYGPTTGYGSSTTLASALVTSHSANLSGLQASTVYHYRVKSRDAAGNLATSGDFTFTTSGDNTAPTISGVGASSITVSAATISWTTNEASDTQVDYGPTTGYGSSTTLGSALVTSHSANLSGLQASTLYHYRVKSRDAAGNLATSGDFTFTTASDTTAPTISGVGASSITVNGATISWTTNEASNTQVDYGPTTGYGSSTVLASAMVTSHSASLSGLQTSTLYHYRVKSRDAAGNLAASGDFTFTTGGDSTAPLISGVGVSSIAAAGATVSWMTDEASDTQVDYGPTPGYGSSTALASALVTSHSVSLSGLQGSTLYHYRVKSRDAAGNLATSGDFTFTTTIDTTAPTISAVGAISITSTSADITWLTNELSDSQTLYGTTSAYGTLTAVAPTLVTAHVISLSGLQASTLYHYQVKSRDGAGNLATSTDFTFTTSADNGTPDIFDISASSITTTSATINWRTNNPSDSQVEYGTAHAYNNTTPVTSVPVTTHAVVVSGLQPSTIYHYRVRSRAGGNLAISGDQTFTTADASETTINEITLSNVGNTSVSINWTTSRATTGLIEYGPVTVSDYRVSDLNMAIEHLTQLNGLLPSTLYHYRLTARDINNRSVASNILVFKTSDELNQPAKPSSQAIFILSVVENSRFRTNLGINNTGSSAANVSMTLVDKQGMVLGNKTVQVDSQGLKQINSVARFLFQNSLGNEVQGSLYLESDQPTCAWVSQIENTTNDPSLLLSKHIGTTKLLIPSAANISSFSSSLVVMNVGTESAQVLLKAYDVNGAVLGQTATPLSVDPNGLLSFENVLETLGVQDSYGPVEITSVNNMPLIASSRVSSVTNMGGFFEGLKYSDASRTQIIPQIVDTTELRTNIGINNTADTQATVMVRLVNQDGVEMAAAPVLVPPKGLSQMNNAARQLLNRSGVSNFEGYVRLDSNQPIFGWASIIDNATNDPGFAVARGQGSTRLLVDSTANVGSFRSSLVVVNTGDGDAIVDIVSHDVTGRISGERRNLVIPAHASFSHSNILENVGVTNDFGPLEIISTNGQPIIATSRVYSTSRTSGFFQSDEIE